MNSHEKIAFEQFSKTFPHIDFRKTDDQHFEVGGILVDYDDGKWYVSIEVGNYSSDHGWDCDVEELGSFVHFEQAIVHTLTKHFEFKIQSAKARIEDDIHYLNDSIERVSTS